MQPRRCPERDRVPIPQNAAFLASRPVAAVRSMGVLGYQQSEGEFDQEVHGSPSDDVGSSGPGYLKGEALVAHSIEDAEVVLRDVAGVIAPNGFSSAGLALEIFASYGRENFDLPDSPEVDGMLFQEGIRGLTGRPLFTVSFVRQFDRLDADGENLEYYHLRIELLYEVTKAFRSLPKRKLWWFREDAGSSDGLEGVGPRDPCRSFMERNREGYSLGIQHKRRRSLELRFRQPISIHRGRFRWVPQGAYSSSREKPCRNLRQARCSGSP